MSRTSTRLGLLVLAALVLAPFLLLASSRQAAAHPLGNFTINRYARIEVSESAVFLRYVVDFAEIPAFQEIRAFDRDGDGLLSETETSTYLSARGPELQSKLELRLDGGKVLLNPTSSSAALVDGQGGLKTLRVVLDHQAELPSRWQERISATFRDRNYDGTPGWREVVVRPGLGVNVMETNASSEDLSAELTAYPETRLQSPPAKSAAEFALGRGEGFSSAPVTPSAEQRIQTPKYLEGFARLIEHQQLTPPFVALSLLAAMAWGAAHAVGPGHGKTVVAAYLVGSRGTARHALLLGLVVTFAHISSVVTLGLVTLYASRYLSADDLYLWLSVASGFLVLAIGCGLLLTRYRRFRGGRVFERHNLPLQNGHHNHEEHDHGHSHDRGGHHHDDNGHGHSHEVTAPGIKGLVLLGLSGGILPCPTALVVMLGAIVLDRIEYGLVLISSFSLGLAGVLTAVGLALVYAKRLLERPGRIARLAAAPLTSRWLQALPLGSAAIIMLVGAYLTSNALSVAL